MAATVSVSSPMATAVWSASCRWRHGSDSGTGVCQIAARAAWKALTTKPLALNRDGGPTRASSMRSAQKDRRSAGSNSMPSRTPSTELDDAVTAAA